MRKEGFSGVIVTVIMVGLVLIAISIAWIVISNLMEHELEDISEGTNYVTLEIKSATINDGTMKVNVERGYGKGDLDAIKFILDDGFNDPEEITLNTTLRETKDKVFLIDTELTGDIKINIIPIIIAANGKEKELTIRDTFEMADPTLIGYWAFEGNADDSSGNGNDGIVEGATLTTGKIGQAYEFDGVGDYVNVPDDDSFDFTNEMTVAGWFKFDKLDSSWRILVRKSSVFTFDLYHTGFFRFYLWPGLGSIQYAESNFNVGKWYHIAGTYKGGDATKLYVNGINVKTSGAGTSPMVINDLDVFIGGLEGSTFIDGSIDEVKVWNRALSEEEIENIYNWEK